MKWLQRTCIAVFPFVIGCVSVSMPSGAVKKADGVVFAAPNSPFRSLASDADHAWVSTETGNTISYISDCGAKTDPSLNQLLAEAINAMDNPEIQEENMVSLSGRMAKTAVVAGDLDGVDVKVKIVTLKKNSCDYTLSYTGVSQSFDREKAFFESFLKGFKAP